MTTILALRALGLGDALTGVPALRGLRRRWPRGELVLAASAGAGDWLRSLGLVDRVLVTSGLAPLAWTGPPPDVAVNLHGRGPQSHRLLATLRPGELVAFDCPEAGVTGPRWRADEHEVDRWIRLVRSVGATCDPDDLRLDAGADGERTGSVVLHPGASAVSRRWPAERWAELASALVARGRRVVVTGTEDEQELCAAVAERGAEDRCGADDLRSLSALVASADLVVCGDTGVAHLATAHATPSVVLFGPVAPALWGPRVDHHLHRVLWLPQASDPAGDPHGDVPDPRLLRITVAQVLGAAEDLRGAARLSRPRAPAS